MQPQRDDGILDAAVLRSVVDAASDAIITVDAGQLIRLFNRAAADLLGWAESDLVGRPLSLLLPPSVRENHHDLVQAFGAAPGVWRRMTTGRPMLTALHRDGHEVPVEASISAVVIDGQPCYTAILRDVSQQRALEANLRRLSLYDPITELPNRALLTDRLTAALAALDGSDDVLAVYFVDVDRFKRINDALGHHAGDTLLTDFAARLRATVRAGDMVGRFAGDEFLVLARFGPDRDEVLEFAERLRGVWETPFVVEGHITAVTASVGVSVASGPDVEPETVVKRADQAMYRAKQGGRNRVELHDPSRVEAAVARLDLERDLSQAVARGEIEVFYQPIVNVRTGRIVGAEALARWRRNGRLVPPAEFVPVAEDTGLIVGIGERVLRQACLDATAFRALAGHAFRIAVNLSPRQVEPDRLPDTVAAALALSGLPADALTLEITESFLLDPGGDVVPTLAALRGTGVHLALDDFGTGYSSLSHLRSLPVTEVKIDQSFMDEVTTPHSEDRAIVTAVLAMARALGLRTVVEGVETSEQAALLTELDADDAQGYLWSAPVPAARFADLLGTGVVVPRPRSAPATAGTSTVTAGIAGTD